jgi:hypothetical protein
MQGNNRETSNGATGIIQPRFPRLKTKSQFEIIQYEIGRKVFVEKLEVFYSAFQNYFDILERPIIRKNTEPFEIAEYYYQIAKDLCVANDIDHNIIGLFLNNAHSQFEEESKPLLYFRTDVQEFFGFGIGWVKSLNNNYKNWFLYIFQCLRNDFQLSDSWEIIEILSQSGMYDPENFDDTDKEEQENAREQREEIAKMKTVEFAKFPFKKKYKRPARIQKPQTDFEKKVYPVILTGIELLEEIKGKSIFDFFNMDEADGYGHMYLSYVYLICDSWYNATPEVGYHVFEQFIDDHANQVGITPYEIGSDKFDLDDFDFTPILLLNKFHSQFNPLEREYHDKYGNI